MLLTPGHSCPPPHARLQGTLGGRLLKDDGATPFTAGFEPYEWEQQVNGTVRSAL